MGFVFEPRLPLAELPLGCVVLTDVGLMGFCLLPRGAVLPAVWAWEAKGISINARIPVGIARDFFDMGCLLKIIGKFPEKPS
jgi:hypothetical protein